MNRVTCKDCIHSHRQIANDDKINDASPGSLECRRFPPTIFPVPMQNKITQQMQLGIQGAFPVMDPDAWCGEGAPNPDKRRRITSQSSKT